MSILKYLPSQPLFLYLPFTAVHDPIQAPERYTKPYEEEIVDDTRRTLAGMVTCLDEAIGNITKTLRKTGLFEDTVIIFTTGKK